MSCKDTCRHPCQFCLSFCSVFIVVLSILIVNSVVEKGPVIFLRLGENTYGEYDGLYYNRGCENCDDVPKTYGTYYLLNYTRITELEGFE